jgi:hypothetical protein
MNIFDFEKKDFPNNSYTIGGDTMGLIKEELKSLRLTIKELESKLDKKPKNITKIVYRGNK